MLNIRKKSSKSEKNGIVLFYLSGKVRHRGCCQGLKDLRHHESDIGNVVFCVLQKDWQDFLLIVLRAHQWGYRL